MSTADGEGIVDSALFTPGLVMENDQIVFVMLDRLIHRNLQTNPNAMFLFMEDTPGYIGKRLSLTKINESTDRSPDRENRQRMQYSFNGFGREKICCCFQNQ